jgi:hypothetical protein
MRRSNWLTQIWLNESVVAEIFFFGGGRGFGQWGFQKDGIKCFLYELDYKKLAKIMNVR